MITAEFRAGWRPLLAAMLGIAFGFPTVAFYTVGIFAPIWSTEFGWSFASIFGGLALAPVVLVLGGPFVGHLVDRHGPRWIAAVSLAGLGISYMTLALSSGSIALYYASWMAMAVTGVGATPISFTRAVTGAFVARRGFALGIALAGPGLFAFIVKPFGNWLVDIAGWRAAIAVIGLLPLLVGMPLVLWGFPAKPSVAAAARTVRLGMPPGGLTVNEALRTRAFRLMVLAFLPISFAVGAPLPNMENILRSLRIGLEDIVMLTSLIGVTSVTGRLVGGWLIDRIWAPLVGAVVLCGGAVACWLLSQHALSSREAMFAVVLLGFAAGVEFDLLSYLVGRYIGVRSYGVVYGTLFGLFAVGAGAGPSLLGYAYDRAGSYSQIMLVSALLLLIAAVLLICMGRYPDRVEEAVGDHRFGAKLEDS